MNFKINSRKLSGLFVLTMLSSLAVAEGPAPLFPKPHALESASEKEILAYANELESRKNISRLELERGRYEIVGALLEKGSSWDSIQYLRILYLDPPRITERLNLCKHDEEHVIYPYDGIKLKATHATEVRMQANRLRKSQQSRTSFLESFPNFWPQCNAGNYDLEVLLMALDAFSDEEAKEAFDNIYSSDIGRPDPDDATRLRFAIAFRLGLELDPDSLTSVVLWEFWQRLDEMPDAEKDFFLKIVSQRSDFSSALDRRSKKGTESSASSESAKGVDQVFTYTQQNLGYVVPLPINSETPVDGFRSYDALTDRYTNLANANSTVTRTQTGTSFRSRPIYSYEFLKDSTVSTPEGIEKGAVVFEGGIHAREWASPEAVAGIFEWLALEESSDPLAQYILDQLNIVIHPLANPDGILQTQRFPNQVVSGFGFPSGGENRDGRNRRKNMRNVDEILSTTNDAQMGIDLNRNHSNGYSGGNPTGITYGGTSPESEPESGALYAAANLIDTDRLRLFQDFHSAANFTYVSLDFTTDYDVAALAVTDLMDEGIRAATGLVNGSPQLTDFDRNSFQGFDPIGATEETFALLFGCLAYTPELRTPRVSSGNSFVLPNNEVADLRLEQLTATQNALYYMAGHASIVSFEARASDTTIVHQTNWQYNPTTETRDRAETVNESLQPGITYDLILRFNKPVRLDRGSGFGLLPGAQANNLNLAITGIMPNSTASFAQTGEAIEPLNYEGDTIVYQITVPGALAGQSISLSFTGEDASGLNIDANPTTVADWSRQGWINGETGTLAIGTLNIATDTVPLSDLYLIK